MILRWADRVHKDCGSVLKVVMPSHPLVLRLFLPQAAPRGSLPCKSDPTAETVGQKLNTKNLVQLKVVGKLSRNDTLFRAQEMLRYAGRDSWEPVCICVVAAQNEEAGAQSTAALRSETCWG